MKKQKLGISFIRTIKMKMIGSFLVPVFLMIALGIISYQKASVGLIEKYEQSTQNTLNMTSKYFEVVLHSVKSKAAQMNSDTTINTYYGGIYSFDSYKEKNSKEAIKKTVESVVNEDDYVGDIYIW